MAGMSFNGETIGEIKKGSGQETELALRVANHITAMLAYWDKTLVCRFANAAYVDWFGKTHEEMIDKITLRELLGESLYKRNLPYILGALEGKTQTFEREIPLPSGASRFSLANYFPDVVNGDVKGFFVHVADISPVKLLENELIQSSEIITAQNKRLVGFTHIVSHNLRSYSRNLESILDLLIQAGTDAERNKMLGYLKSISRGFSSTVDHLSEIITDQGPIIGNVRPVNLFEYIDNTIDVLRIQLKTVNGSIYNKVDRDLFLQINPAYLESILLNFLTNAIKYKHPERDLQVELSTTIESKGAILRISDNGLGIDLQKYGDKIFGMHQTFHGNKDATGVGLFITKYQIESMGGRVEVESQVDVGTTFKIHFAK